MNNELIPLILSEYPLYARDSVDTLGIKRYIKFKLCTQRGVSLRGKKRHVHKLHKALI